MSEEGRRVYVGNLDKNTNKDEVEELFVRFGKIESLWLAKNPSGFGFVVFESTDQAEDAVREMNGVDFKGQPLKVEISTSDGRRKKRNQEPRRESRYDSYMTDRRPQESRHSDRYHDDRRRADHYDTRDYGRRDPAPREYDRYDERRDYDRRDYYDHRPADYGNYDDRREPYDRAFDYRRNRSRSAGRRYYDDRR